jgi:hypothetical protein
MQMSKIGVAVGALVFLSTTLWADTLTFIAQPGLGGGLDYSWFSSGNWFASDSLGNLTPAGRVPLANEGAVITGLADAEGGGIRLQSLLVTNNAVITNGTFAVQQLDMRSGSSFNNAVINLLSTYIAGGTNCQLNASVFTIFATATATVQPVLPASSATLILDRGAILRNNSRVILTEGSQILGGSIASQSQLINSPGALLTATNATWIQGTAGNHLIVDNNGTIRCEGGTLNFGSGLDWLATSGSGEFQAGSTNALMLFNEPFHDDASVYDLFTGPGRSRWLAGATVDGTVQVNGNLDVLDSVSGGGQVLAAGSSTPAGVLTWINGTFSIPRIGVESGANLVLTGDPGSARQLAGCAINNSGSCTLIQGNLGFSGGGAINNLPGGTLDFQATNGLALLVTSGAGVVDNAGTVRNSGGATIQFGVAGLSPGPDFNNRGLVDLGGGQLNLLGGSSSGEFRTADAAKLWFWGGTHTLGAGVAFTGNGAVELHQGLSPARWRITDPIRVAGLALGINGTVDAASNTSTNPVHFDSLQMTANGTLSEGKFELSAVSMLDESTITNSTVAVLNQLKVQGTKCALHSSTVRTASGSGTRLGSTNQTPPAHLILADGSAVVNSGTFEMTGGAYLTGTTPPQNQFILAPGALLLVTNSSRIEGSSTNHLTFVNVGGVVVGENTTLRIEDTADCTTVQGTGTFLAAAPSSVIEFAGPFRAESGALALFTGAGTNRWLAGAVIAGDTQVGSANAPSTAVVPQGNLEVLDSVSGSGALSVSGGAGLPGLLTWINGTIAIPTLTVQSSAKLRLVDAPGSTRHLSHCQVNNSGQFLWLSQTGLLAGSGAALVNLAGGLLDIQVDSALAFDNVPPLPLLNNAGVFLKSAGTGLTPIAADFKNSGSFTLQSGTLDFQDVWMQTDGNSQVNTGAVLKASALSILGGKVAGSGTIDAAVNNSAMMSPGSSPGILTIAAGKDFQQSSLGVLKVEIGGTAPGTQYDRLTVGGSASLAGRLQVSLINGFSPKPGDTFPVLTASSVSGSFSVIDPTGIPGAFWAPFYTGTNVVLTLGYNLVLPPPVISGNSVTLSFITSPGVVYLLQSTDTVSPANWRTIDTVPGDGTVHAFQDTLTPTQRFYRLISQ